MVHSEKKAKPLNIAILGTGMIALDLLKKVMRSNKLHCFLVSGRNAHSAGLNYAKDLGVRCSDQSIDAIMENIDSLDLVFDATSAKCHVRHWETLREKPVKVIDMTPSKVGTQIVPVVNLPLCAKHNNLNMISCGGQVSIPIAHCIGQSLPHVEYIEVVSSIASKSAGPATRENLDEYIHTTEQALVDFSGASKSKVLLILNPASPPIIMQTTISAIIDAAIDLSKLEKAVHQRICAVQAYVPGYKLLLGPVILEKNRLLVTVTTTGIGDYLPEYAGNLDIINSAAIAVSEYIADIKYKGLTDE